MLIPSDHEHGVIETNNPNDSYRERGREFPMVLEGAEVTGPLLVARLRMDKAATTRQGHQVGAGIVGSTDLACLGLEPQCDMLPESKGKTVARPDGAPGLREAV